MMKIAVLLCVIAVACAFNVKSASRVSNVVMMADKSKSLPFMPRPANLDVLGGAGDVGKFHQTQSLCS
jgi:hypothetical protein